MPTSNHQIFWIQWMFPQMLQLVWWCIHVFTYSHFVCPKAFWLPFLGQILAGHVFHHGHDIMLANESDFFARDGILLIRTGLLEDPIILSARAGCVDVYWYLPPCDLPLQLHALVITKRLYHLQFVSYQINRMNWKVNNTLYVRTWSDSWFTKDRWLNELKVNITWLSLIKYCNLHQSVCRMQWLETWD